jgi:hypothetical protein
MGPAQRPNDSGDPNDRPKKLSSGLNTSVISLPLFYTFGNAPLNAVTAPALQEFDLSLQKDIRLREAIKLRFRAEVYNICSEPDRLHCQLRPYPGCAGFPPTSARSEVRILAGK